MSDLHGITSDLNANSTFRTLSIDKVTLIHNLSYSHDVYGECPILPPSTVVCDVPNSAGFVHHKVSEPLDGSSYLANIVSSLVENLFWTEVLLLYEPEFGKNNLNYVP